LWERGKVISLATRRNGRNGLKDRKRFFNIASTSASESAAAFDIAFFDGAPPYFRTTGKRYKLGGRRRGKEHS
jgi:hypothetical protein